MSFLLSAIQSSIMVATPQESSQAFGRRLLSSVIDERAANTPQKPFMSIPAGKIVSEGQKDITYGEMARAINRCAWWIEETIGGKGVDFPTIATYLQPMDIRHPILTMGAVKAGYKMFYSSPRNRHDVQIEMLEQLGCALLFTPEEESETTKAVIAQRNMSKHILPELDWFLAEGLVEPYPYHKTFEEAANDPYCILHSSGSTGTPKILVLKQGSVAAHDTFQRFSEDGEEPWVVSSWSGKRVATNFPWLHAAGAYLFAMCVYLDFVPIIPASWIFTAADAGYLHTHGKAQVGWYSPSVLIDLTREPSMLKTVGRLDSISYSGGVLPESVGEKISKHTFMCGIMGSTETGVLPCVVPPSDRWNYYRFNSRLGHEFRHYAEDMYELVLSRNAKAKEFQAAFFTLPEAQTYGMRDLYVEHPTHKGWWRSAGRVDDVVIMSDAKKLNAVPYEAVIEQHPSVTSALICGSGRPRPAVLVQPSEWLKTKDEENDFINKLWPQLERANHAGPVFGRLIKELVVVAQRSKPMERSVGKNTVQRKRSIALYEKEIDHAYWHAERSGLLYGDVMNKALLI